MPQKILSILFVLGIFLPTSINRDFTNVFVIIGCSILLVAIVFILSKQNRISIHSITIVLIVNLLLFIFTLFTSFTDYRLGTSLYFFTLTLIFCLDFEELKSSYETCRKTLQIINIILVIFSSAIIFGFQPIINIIQNWYSAFYVELLPNMISRHRPVNTFATHSIAGFYTFVFFLINFITYVYLKKKSHLLICILYMVFLFKIQSSTSLVYFGVCFLVFLIAIYRKNKFAFFTIISTGLVYSLIKFKEIYFLSMISEKLFSANNGLLVRYADGGVLSDNLSFISNHPFRGIGFSYTTELIYVDSGIVEYVLRGSVFALIALIAGFFIFLKRNLGLKIALIVFLIFLSFEVGFPNLIYFRSLFIIPFLVAYLSQLQKTNKAQM